MAHGPLQALWHNGFGAPSNFRVRHDRHQTAQLCGVSMAHVRCGTVWHRARRCRRVWRVAVSNAREKRSQIELSAVLARDRHSGLRQRESDSRIGARSILGSDRVAAERRLAQSFAASSSRRNITTSSWIVRLLEHGLVVRLGVIFWAFRVRHIHGKQELIGQLVVVCQARSLEFLRS